MPGGSWIIVSSIGPNTMQVIVGYRHVMTAARTWDFATSGPLPRLAA